MEEQLDGLLADPLAEPQDPQKAPPIGQPPQPLTPDEIITRNIRQRQAQQDEALRASFNVAVKSDPSKAREASRLARRIGLDPDTVERNVGEVKAIESLRMLEERQMSKLSPILARQLSDPDFARRAHDDVDNLSAYAAMSQGAERGRLAVERGRIGSRMWMGGGSPADTERLAVIRQRLQSMPEPSGFNAFLGSAAEFIGQMGETLPAAFGVGAATATVAGVASGPASPLSAPVAFGVGTVSAMVTQMAAVEAGSSYLDLVERGAGPVESRLVSGAVGLANGALEMVGASIVSKPIRDAVLKRAAQEISEQLLRPTAGKAATRAAIEYVKGIGGEVSTEVMQELVSIAGEVAVAGDAEDVGKRLGEVALKTFQGMALLGVPGPVMQFHGDMRRVKASQASVDMAARRAAAAKESRLRQQDPDAFEAMAAEQLAGTDQETTYIDARTFVDVLRQGDKASAEAGKFEKSLVEQVDQLIPGLAEQIEKAAAKGEDVTIPTATFDAKLVGTPIGDLLAQHTRHDAEGLTATELAAVDIETMAKDAEKTAEEQRVAAEQWTKEAKEIETTLATELMATIGPKRSRKDVQTEARLARTMYETLAQGAGMTPGEVWKLHRTSAQAGEVDGAALQQPATDSPEFKAWFGESKVVDEKGAPLVVYHGTPEATAESSKTVRGDAKSSSALDAMAQRFGMESRADLGYFLSRAVTEKVFATPQMEAATQADVDAARALEKKAKPTSKKVPAKMGFEVFNMPAGEQELGVHLGTIEQASAFGPAFPFYLAIKNPLRLPDLGTWNYQSVIREARKAGVKISEDEYDAAFNAADSNEALRKLLLKKGYDGVVYQNEVEGSGDSYIAFEPTQIKSVNNRGTFDPNDPNILRQQGRGGYDPSTGRIVLPKNADSSTVIHELAHAYLTILGDFATKKLSPQFVADFDAFLKWAGVADVAAWNAMSLEQQRKAHENFAANYESYMFEGRAPEPGLKRLFHRITEMLRRVYTKIRDELNAAHRRDFGEELLDLTPEIREVFDRMTASDEAVRATQAIRGAVPVFLTQQEAAAAGMSADQWIEHQRLQAEADDAAVDDVARARLRDMRWLSRAKGKKLREIQAREAKTREGVRIKVAAEVQQLPVYKAIRWLKTGEFVNPDGTKMDDPGKPKMDREAVRQLLGLAELDETKVETEVAPAPKVRRGPSMLTRIKQLGGISTESWNKSWPGERRGEFRLPFVVRPNGMRWEAMASQLRSEGYAPQLNDEAGVGSGDSMWLVDALADAASGIATYSQNDEAAILDTRNPTPETAEEKADRLEAERQDREEEAARRTAIQTARPENALAKLRGLLRKDGMPPDMVAQVVDDTGQMTGERLVREILAARPIEDVIERETDARMLSEHGELSDRRKVDAAIDAALHNPTRLRFGLSELRALAKATEPQRVTMGAVKAAAEASLATKLVRSLNPRQFTMAARRASQAAQEAQSKGDVRAALAAKRQQVLQQAMADLAVGERKALESAVGRFGNYAKTDEKLAKSRDIDLIYVGRWIAGRYGLGSRAETAQQKALTDAAVKKLEADHPAIWQRAQPILARPAMDYRDLTVAEFRELAAVSDWIWEESRAVMLLDAEGKKIALDKAVGELGEQVATLPARLAPGSRLREGVSPPSWKRGVLRVWNMLAGLKRAEQWARYMDGGKDGPFQRYLIAPIMRAVTAFRVEQAKMLRELDAELTALQSRHGARWDAELESEDLSYTFRGTKEILGAMLHAGTDSSLGKLLRGRKGKDGSAWGELVAMGDEQVLDTSKWDAFVEDVFRRRLLGAEDVDFLRRVWGMYAKLLPQAQKAHKAMYRREFETIEHRAFVTPFGTLDGGYVPARIDRDLADPQLLKSEDSLAGDEAAYRYSIEKDDGFTLARNPNYNQALDIDLARQVGHFDKELRFIYLQPVVRDAVRILKNREMEAVLNAYDREAISGVLFPWLENTARQTTARSHGVPFIDALLNGLRRTVSLAGLGFNLANSLLQVTGLSNAVTQVQGRFMRSALAHWASNPAQAFREMTTKSVSMRQRFDADLRKVQDRIRMATNDGLAKPVRKAQAAVARWAFFPQRMFQMLADTVTWHGGYAQAVAQGMDEAAAVEAADGAVRRAQGSQNAEDQARYEAGAPLVKLFTQFGGYSNLVLNQVIGSQSRASAFAWAILLPAIMEGALRGAITPPEDDDGDGMVDEWTAHFGKSLARNVAGTLPVAGPIVLTLANSDGRQFSMPASSVIRDAWVGASATIDALGGDETSAYEARAMAVFWTMATGMPMAAPVRTVQQLTDER